MENTENIVLSKGIPGEPCPIGKTLDIIGTKWMFLIIRDLMLEEVMRFSELQKSMSGISPKTLSLRLRELEANNIITRKVYAEVPPRVEYSLTEKGKQLRGIMVEMKRFGLTL